MMPAGPSVHLSWSELSCKDRGRTPYPLVFIRDGRAATLSALFEQVRSLLGGQPLTVLSGYRTPEHNRKIGGSPDSQHVQGRALDVAHPTLLPRQVVDLVKQAKAAGALPLLGGLGLYEKAGFVHIDTRPVPTGRTLIVWNGGTQLKDARG